MRYKNLSKEQLIISFDRLMRFKPTKDKYFRVFTDIITSNLIEPVYRKQDLINMSAENIKYFAEEIVNASLKSIISSSDTKNADLAINYVIKECENYVFYNDDETQIYLDNTINYNLFAKLIDDSCPTNLRWLKALSSEIQYILPQNNSITILKKFDNEFNNILLRLRHDNGLKFPIQKVLLVEGLTEEILLPAFSKFLGFDFYKEGIHIIAAGGKNQVVKMYYKLIEELKIPIFLLLDKDAESNIRQIKPKLRVYDKIHLVSCGEFEDLLPKSLIIKTVNSELNNFASISEDDFDNSISNAKNLENIFKTKGLHEFKKADFAKIVRDNINDNSDISAEVASIILEIRESKSYLSI